MFSQSLIFRSLLILGSLQCCLGYNCGLIRSKTKHSAGSTRNTTAECKVKNGKFFYEIIWRRPIPTLQPLLGYRIEMNYGTIRVCYQLSANATSFILNETNGFQPNKRLRYAVTPQPIILDSDGKVSVVVLTAEHCPAGPILEPLTNKKKVNIDTNVNFKCKFKNKPVPQPTVLWYFSKDKTNCVNKTRVENNDAHLKLSDDNLTLSVVTVKQQHDGCYIVKAFNSVGKQEERGFIDIDLQSLSSHRGAPKTSHTKFILIIIISTMVALLVLFAAVILYIRMQRKQRISFRLTDLTERKIKTVYISHLSETDSEQKSLLQFVNSLRLFSLKVLVDICEPTCKTEEDTVLTSALAHMKRADKIIVLITQSYINTLKECYANQSSGHLCKFCCEYNHVHNTLKESFEKSKNIVIVTKKDIKSDDIPIIFQHRISFKYPSKTHIECDEDLDEDFRTLLEYLLEKEDIILPRQHLETWMEYG